MFQGNLFYCKLDHEVSICSLIPPAMAISDNMVSRFWHLVTPYGEERAESLACFSIQLVILVMCTKVEVSR